MAKMTDRRPVPGDNQVECRVVASRSGDKLPEKKPFGEFSLPVPVVLASQCPDRLGHSLRAGVFFDEPLPKGIAHFVANGSCMFTAQAECLKQTLTHGGDADLEFPHAIIDQCRIDRRVRGRLVLHNFQGTNTGALNSATA